MNLSSVNSIPGFGFESSTLTGSEATKRQDSAFGDLLKSAKEGASEDEIRQSAEQLVSATFIIPVLSSVREASMAAEPFAPTQGEKQFGAMLDQQVADEIVKSSNLPLVERLAQTFGANSKPAGKATLEVTA
jgi:Rod binding domain-containing protein